MNGYLQWVFDVRMQYKDGFLCVVIILLISCPAIISIPNVQAVGSSLGGIKPLDVILNSNSTILTFNGHAGVEEAEMIHTLAEAGKKILHIQHWWSDLINNPLLIFYNETYQVWAREALNFSLYGTPTSYDPDSSAASINPNDIWGVVLGDEEPSWVRYSNVSSELSADIALYSNEYETETGYDLKPTDEMNLTEYYVFQEWVSEKTVWVYNYLYDHVRKQIPHAQIFQYMMMPPVWGIAREFCPAYELKADGISMDCYYATKQPWLLYETIRRYRAGMPELQFQMTIFGTIYDFLNEAGDGIYYDEGSYEQIRRETWLSYLSSIDSLGYFNWGPQNNDSYDWRAGAGRTDIMGRRLWRYTDNLAGQLALLPKFNPQPEILVVGDGYQTGEAMLNVADLGLFSEYDMVNMRQFTSVDVDITNYSLILVTDGWYYNETIMKLNEYVDNGGNLLFLGGTRTKEAPFNEAELFDIEVDSTETEIAGHVLVNFTAPNMLNLEFVTNYTDFGSYCIDDSGFPSDSHPIGDFQYIVGESLNPVGDYPVVLYHNESEPTSGWTLWVGIHTAKNGALQDPDKKPELWNLYRKIVRGFADYLNITNSISNEDTENMLISASRLDSSTIMAGVMNFENRDRDFTFTYDLSQLGFSSGHYFVHSLDTDQLVGQFDTNEDLLSFGADVVANGTRLFIISETQPTPDYSIDIFPRIPTVAEFNVTTTTTTTTTTDTSTTSTTSTSSTTTSSTTSTSSDTDSSDTQTDSIPDDYIRMMFILGGISSGIVVLVLFFWFKRKNR